MNLCLKSLIANFIVYQVYVWASVYSNCKKWKITSTDENIFANLTLFVKNEWAKPFMESFRDGIIPARAAKPQVQELKIHHESQKAYPNSPRMA